MEERKSAKTQAKPNKSVHMTTGDILEDPGFSAQETLEAKIRADLFGETSWFTSNGEVSIKHT